MRSQVSIDYLILVGIGVILAILAVMGVFFVSSNVGDELKDLNALKSSVIGELK